MHCIGEVVLFAEDVVFIGFLGWSCAVAEGSGSGFFFFFFFFLLSLAWIF